MVLWMRKQLDKVMMYWYMYIYIYIHIFKPFNINIRVNQHHPYYHWHDTGGRLYCSHFSPLCYLFNSVYHVLVHCYSICKIYCGWSIDWVKAVSRSLWVYSQSIHSRYHHLNYTIWTLPVTNSQKIRVIL